MIEWLTIFIFGPSAPFRGEIFFVRVFRCKTFSFIGPIWHGVLVIWASFKFLNATYGQLKL